VGRRPCASSGRPDTNQPFPATVTGPPSHISPVPPTTRSFALHKRTHRPYGDQRAFHERVRERGVHLPRYERRLRDVLLAWPRPTSRSSGNNDAHRPASVPCPPGARSSRCSRRRASLTVLDVGTTYRGSSQSIDDAAPSSGSRSSLPGRPPPLEISRLLGRLTPGWGPRTELSGTCQPSSSSSARSY